MLGGLMQLTNVEDYRALLPEYEREAAEYEQMLKTYRSADAEDEGPGKEELEQKFARVQELYDRLSKLRQSIAQTRETLASR
jgi:hypothetical protein